MKKPGPSVSRVLITSQLVMSMIDTAARVRWGVAITRRPSYSQVMPEPRWGIPSRGRSATFSPLSRSTTMPPSPPREAPMTCW